MKRRLLASLLVAAASMPSALGAQSLLGAGGLGFPLRPIDARSLALGSSGVGLFGPSILPADPAAAADLAAPALTFTLQSSWIDVEGPARPEARGARFPVIGAAYPVFDVGMATLTFGGVMDQRWGVEVERTVALGEESARVTDEFVSDGGVSAVRLGFARRMSPGLSLGVAVGSYVGEVTRRFSRTFDSLSIPGSVPGFEQSGSWQFSGPTLTAGATVDVGSVLRAAGSITWSGTLEAEPVDDTEGRPAEFDVPLEIRLGASGALTPGLDLVVGLGFADWSDAVDGDPDTAGTSTFEIGTGLEFDQFSLFGRGAPLRVGFRRSELPFRFDGDDPVETVWTGGMGLNLVQVGPIPVVRVDLAAERGDRSAGSLSETFWRARATFRVAGF